MEDLDMIYSINNGNINNGNINNGNINAGGYSVNSILLISYNYKNDGDSIINDSLYEKLLNLAGPDKKNNDINSNVCEKIKKQTRSKKGKGKKNKNKLTKKHLLRK